MVTPGDVLTAAGEAIIYEVSAPSPQGSKDPIPLASIDQVLQVAKFEIENCTDGATKAEMERLSLQLSKLWPTLARSIKRSAPTAADTVLKDTTCEVISTIQTLRQVVGGPSWQSSVDLTAQLATAGIGTLSFSDEGAKGSHTYVEGFDEKDEDASESAMASTYAPLPAAVATITTGPIASAVANLKKETARWSSRNNPIVGKAKDIADKMQDMANLQAAIGNDATLTVKSNLISTARVIASSAQDIVTYARKVADGCSDKRLKEDILFLCERVFSMGTQLKIISSVKAASSSSDTDADAMMVKNAQNLTDAVQKLVRACEAASLRMATTATTVVMAIRWAKKSRESVFAEVGGRRLHK
jgi:vinculin